MRRAPSSHRRGVNLLKMVLPARGYSPPCCYEPLHSGPVVEPAGMTSSLTASQCSDLPDTVTPAAQWPPGFQGTESRPRWLTEGRGLVAEEEGGGMEDREWREISSLRRIGERLEGWRKGGRGEVDRGRRQARFLIKVDYSQQPYATSKAHLSRNYDRLHTTKWED